MTIIIRRYVLSFNFWFVFTYVTRIRIIAHKIITAVVRIESLDIGPMRRTSTGWDGLPSWLFRKCSVELATDVAHLVNFSITLGQKVVSRPTVYLYIQFTQCDDVTRMYFLRNSTAKELNSTQYVGIVIHVQ